MHARSWREANSQEAKVIARVCGPQTSEMPHKLASRVNQATRNCECREQQIRSPHSHEVITPASVHALWAKWSLKSTCEVHKVETVSAISHRSMGELKEHGILIATDHENKTVDAMFIAMGGILSPKTRQLPAEFALDGGDGNDDDEEVKSIRDLAPGLFGLLVDLTVQSLVDEFIGVPASSLTRVVCMWRRARYNKTSDLCTLLDILTISDDCNELNDFCSQSISHSLP
jgi:hypothetical protein